MAVHISSLHPEFGASLTGFSIADGVSDADFAAILAAFEKYSVIVFPDQPMTVEQHVRFSERFGELEVALTKLDNDDVSKHVALLSNLDSDGNIVPNTHRVMLNNKANSLWHTDSTFKPRTALASMLYGVQTPPEGGETEFVSTRAAYRRLTPEQKQRVESLWAVHDFGRSRAKIGKDLIPDAVKKLTPPQRRPLIRVHPDTGEKSLYVASHCTAIEGMDDAKARSLLDELIEHCTSEDLIYRHQWSDNDLVMWDNRATMHRGRPWRDDRHIRIMHRTTVIDPVILDANYGDESSYQSAMNQWDHKTASEQTTADDVRG